MAWGFEMTEEQRLKRNEYMKAYHHRRKSDPKYIHDRVKSRKKSKDANRETLRAQSRIHIAQWRKKHPEWRKELRQAAYARKKGVLVEKANYEAIFERWDGSCGICGELVNGAYHYDHIIPISKGGPHKESNIQITHAICNRVKQDKILEMV